MLTEAEPEGAKEEEEEEDEEGGVEDRRGGVRRRERGTEIVPLMLPDSHQLPGLSPPWQEIPFPDGPPGCNRHQSPEGAIASISGSSATSPRPANCRATSPLPSKKTSVLGPSSTLASTRARIAAASDGGVPGQSSTRRGVYLGGTVGGAAAWNLLVASRALPPAPTGCSAAGGRSGATTTAPRNLQRWETSTTGTAAGSSRGGPPPR
ncbi:unnamed protein product [Prorocentrum cordatum]|uniref:Uncharacterized protein n=1 Tax=Prorocentrum cordatum TaxID=2364126 RepID=A0ABN9UUS4_9DINO|nr:unnamed protein product [Polarella glacialis]